MTLSVGARTWSGPLALAENLSPDFTSVDCIEISYVGTLRVFIVGTRSGKLPDGFIEDVDADDRAFATSHYQVLIRTSFEESGRLLTWPRIFLRSGCQRPEASLLRSHVGLSSFTETVALPLKWLQLFFFLLSWTWIFILVLYESKTC